jgi:hypothetical protein
MEGEVMPRRCLGTVDLDTGELLNGVPVWIGRRPTSPYGSRWMQMNQDALAEIAADPDLGLQAWKVFAYLNSRLDFDNLIQVPQIEIAQALRMKPAAVSRAIRLLSDKKIIIRGPKVGRSSSFQLNAYYGFKGKIKNIRPTIERQLRCVGTPSQR